MGFLTVGRRFLEDIHDIADDRIDVVSRGLLGLTVSCARCHDHKFDPIPTSDYYSPYGVFTGSVERTRTLLASERTADETAYQQELRIREDALDGYLLRRHTELLAAFRAQAENLPTKTVRRPHGLPDCCSLPGMGSHAGCSPKHWDLRTSI